MQKTFKSLAEAIFNKYSRNRLLYDYGNRVTLSYSEGFHLIQLASTSLIKSGLKKGDIIISFASLNLESVILCWACLANGYVFVPVDHNWTPKLLTQIIDETSPKLIFTDEDRFSVVAALFPKHKILKTGILSNDKDENSFSERMIQIGEKESTIEDKTNPHDLAIILYTSGSTGTPKGVMLSQQALFNSGKLVSEHFEWSMSDVFLNLGDLHSMSGLRNTCLSPLHVGASFVIANEERNHVLNLIKLIHEQQIVYIGVAPIMIRQLNIIYSLARKQLLTSLKAVLCTGGMLSKSQLKEFYQNYNIPVLNYYGLTETCGFCAGHSIKTFSIDNNSIGYPVGAEFLVKSDNQDNNDEVSGELLIKSGNLTMGYYKKEKETSDVFKNGYFYTGDIVKKRSDGCFELIGRKKNIVKNVYSELIHLEEIENILETHHLIREASTCSYSHFEEDEKIIAFVVFKDKRENTDIEVYNNIKQFMYKNIGKHRSPWRYYIEESIPVGSTGKVQRQILKEKLYAYLQSEHKRYF